MIVNLENKEKYPFLNRVKRNITGIYIEFGHYFSRKKIYLDSIRLKKFFKNNYPSLKQDNNGNLKCVSCLLCEEACPTDAISIKKANLVNFPDSIKTGESPLHFYLDVNKCIKCGMCESVCYVDALDLTKTYKVNKVDLVAKEA